MTLDIVIAELEREAAEDTALDETFDLDLDETRELPLPDDDFTRPYELSPCLIAPWLAGE